MAATLHIKDSKIKPVVPTLWGQVAADVPYWKVAGLLRQNGCDDIVLAFGKDRIVLSGQGLPVDDITPGMAVQFQGRTGRIVDVDQEKDTFREAFRPSLALPGLGFAVFFVAVWLALPGAGVLLGPCLVASLLLACGLPKADYDVRRKRPDAAKLAALAECFAAPE